MSSSMSRSKVKWTGVALSAVAAGILLPAAAKAAGTLSVSLDLHPLGTTPATTDFIVPGQTYPVYVYATVTGSSTISSGEIDGLQYLYYNIGNAVTGTGGAQVVSAALNPNFVNNGSQVGVVNPVAGTSVGGTVLTNYAKPRTGLNGVFSTAADGTNVIVNSGSSSVTFLVETLQIAAPGTATSFAYSTPGNLNQTTFSISIPTISSPYTGSNFFTDLTTPVTTGSRVPAANTTDSSASAGASVTLINDINGDANDDGTVNASDLLVVAQHYKTTGDTRATGDFNGDGSVDASDLLVVAQNYKQTLGVTPASQFGSVAGSSSVPEPATLGLLASAGVLALGRRRRA